MKRFPSVWVVPVSLTVLLTAGCVTLTPRTEALKQVHDVYQREFAALQLPAPDQVKDKSGAQSGSPFAGTLAAIREAGLLFPTNAAETAHLKVLEGMVYLQSGRVGMARAIAPEVRQAATLLSSRTGRIVRDQLYASNYVALVDGWETILFFQSKVRSGGSGPDAEAAVKRLWLTLTNAAMRLDASLSGLGADRLADGDADQGALYLATCGAIFYAWAVQLYPDDTTRAQVQADWLGRGRKLIGRFLTDNEKQVVDAEGQWRKDRGLPAQSPDPTAYSEGRWRYVRWYHWLKENESGPANPG